MSKVKCKSYAPHERGFFEQKPQRIRAYSAKDYTELPDPVRDPIVVNNIAFNEFDYTYNNEGTIFNDYLKDITNDKDITDDKNMSKDKYITEKNK